MATLSSSWCGHWLLRMSIKRPICKGTKVLCLSCNCNYVKSRNHDFWLSLFSAIVLIVVHLKTATKFFTTLNKEINSSGHRLTSKHDGYLRWKWSLLQFPLCGLTTSELFKKDRYVRLCEIIVFEQSFQNHRHIFIGHEPSMSPHGEPPKPRKRLFCEVLKLNTRQYNSPRWRFTVHGWRVHLSEFV